MPRSTCFTQNIGGFCIGSMLRLRHMYMEKIVVLSFLGNVDNLSFQHNLRLSSE